MPLRFLLRLFVVGVAGGMVVAATTQPVFPGPPLGTRPLFADVDPKDYLFGHRAAGNSLDEKLWNSDALTRGLAFSQSVPTVVAVSPTEAYNFQPATVSIIGANFVPTPTVTFGNLPLSDVTFVSSTTLTATVPAHLPGGTYSIGVVNPDAQSASLSAAFTVRLSGDGSLGSWQAMRPMSSARDWPAAIQAAGFLYVLGGGYPDFLSGRLSSVERAAIGADRSLGPWEAPTSMVTARSVFAVVHALEATSMPLVAGAT